MRKLLLAFCGVAMLATTPALANDTCIRRNEIRKWHPGPNKTLTLDDGRQQVTIKMTGSCEGFGIYDPFSISSPTGKDFSCVEVGDRIVTHWAGERGVCEVTAVGVPAS